MTITSRTKAILITVGDDTPSTPHGYGILIEAMKENPRILSNHSLRGRWSLTDFDVLRQQGLLKASFPVARISAQYSGEYLSELALRTTNRVYFWNRCRMTPQVGSIFFFWAENTINNIFRASELPIQSIRPSDAVARREGGSWYLAMNECNEVLDGNFMTRILRSQGVIYPEYSAFVCRYAPGNTPRKRRHHKVPPLEVIMNCTWCFSPQFCDPTEPEKFYPLFPVHRQHSPPDAWEIRRYVRQIMSCDDDDDDEEEQEDSEPEDD